MAKKTPRGSNTKCEQVMIFEICGASRDLTGQINDWLKKAGRIEITHRSMSISTFDTRSYTTIVIWYRKK